MDDRRIGTYSLALLAAVAQSRGHVAEAGRVWGAVDGEHARTPPTPGWKRYFDELRGALSDASPEFEVGVAQGRRLEWEDAVAYELAGRNTPPRESGMVRT
jgi:hypothetical protein